MYCIHCGSELPDGSKFCTNCGRPTEAPEADGLTAIDGVDEAGDALTTQLPPSGAPSLQQAEPVASPAPYSEQERNVASKGGLPTWAVAVIVGVVVALLVGGGVFLFNKAGQDSAAQQQAEADAASAQQQAAAASEAAKNLTVTVSGSDTSAFPTVSASLKVVDADGNGVTGLVSTDVKVTEKRSDGSVKDATVTGLVSNGGGAYQLSFTAQDSDDSAESRSATISCASASRTWEEIGFSYTAPAKEKKSESSSSSAAADSGQATTTQILVVTTDSSADYMMPSSNSAYYSADDIKNLSDWELYLARNEIYARHGRGFNNADLQRYFYSKSWYRRTCDPDKFDESVLNKYERANAATILAREKAVGSQYI